MIADAGRRYRAYPTSEQAVRLTEWGHSCRAVWNIALEQRQFAWRQRGATIRASGQCRALTQARAELPWLADLPAQSAQQVLRQLDRAYDNWWNPEHPAKAPTFRRRGAGLSIPFPGQAVAVRELSRRWAEVRLPKVGRLRFRLSRPLGGAVRNATVRQDGLGWHVCFGVATGVKPAPPNGLPGCGVDFGVACSAFVSDEPLPRLMAPSLTLGEQRRLLGLEGRNVKQKAGLNRSILDNAPYERRRQLVYKAPRFGSELRLVPAPGTSQTCSACGTRDPESRQGCGRTFACAACGHQAHADLNAACNIQRLAAGQAAYSTRSHPTVARPLGSRTREPLGSAA